jgi:hypothetical protein
MWQIGGLCFLDVDVCGNGVIIIGSYTSCFHVDVLSGLDPAWEKSFSSSREQDWQPEEGQADLSMVSWRVWCCFFWHVRVKSQMKMKSVPVYKAIYSSQFLTLS